MSIAALLQAAEFLERRDRGKLFLSQNATMFKLYIFTKSKWVGKSSFGQSSDSTRQLSLLPRVRNCLIVNAGFQIKFYSAWIENIIETSCSEHQHVDELHQKTGMIIVLVICRIFFCFLPLFLDVYCYYLKFLA
jgi:hypothetical protein